MRAAIPPRSPARPPRVLFLSLTRGAPPLLVLLLPSSCCSSPPRYDWVAEAPPAADFLSAKKPKKPGMTKTALAQVAVAQAKMAEPVDAAPWKMSAFASVPPKVGYQG